MTIAERRLLFERFEGLRGRVPWCPLATLPTPVTEAKSLSSELGAPIWIKHDEATSPVYGGNKLRKLELLVAEADALGAHRWIVYGPLGSNWVLATCILGRLRGREVHAILFRRPLHEQSRRSFSLSSELATEAHVIAHPVLVPWKVLQVKRRLGPNAHVLPPGGTSALSTLGYVEAGLELAEQVRSGDLPEPASIVVAHGTGGTVAGLAIGVAAGGLSSRVLGVRVADRIVANRWVARRLIRSTARLLDPSDPALQRAPLELIGGELAPGYGRPSISGERAQELARRLEGLRLDATYTAKALAGAAKIIQSGSAGAPFLFWNTYQSQRLDDLPARLDAARSGKA
ncbi:MAG: pyridoxal-phosphate dependent enzyme [Planctomycetota bacterium]